MQIEKLSCEPAKIQDPSDFSRQFTEPPKLPSPNTTLAIMDKESFEVEIQKALYESWVNSATYPGFFYCVKHNMYSNLIVPKWVSFLCNRAKGESKTK